ncbi:virion core protein, T7 gp14 family [Ruegeria atlantica]|uniref:virion core protein, T7 gp14 family n=1 Tax=Ruegeria atlantica TaxID=81569 RepID=UPI001481BA9D|nr:hypothetical protein [Ruegeria atlantica]
MSLPLILPALQTAVTAISTAAPAISAGLSVIGAASAYGQASAQAEAQAKTNANMEAIARTDMQDSVDQINLRQKQETEAATEQQIDHQNAANRAVASAKVGASGSGVTGFSVDALLGDLYGQHATNKDRINMNLENTTDQLNAERDALATNYTRTVASLPTPQKPSALGYGVQAGLGVMDAYKDKFKVIAEARKDDLSEKP